MVSGCGRITVSEGGVDGERERLTGPSSTWTCLVNEPTRGLRGLRALVSNPKVIGLGEVILAPLVLLQRIARGWRRRRAA